MNATDLKTILDNHAKWLRGETGGVSADLRFADLSFANLRFANLSFANLRFANLRFADLRFANLRFADLSFANLRSANGVEDKYLKRQQIVPEVGAFQAFKKAHAGRQSVVIHLEIPAEAKRVGGVVGRKCRASAATVLGFFALDESPLPDVTEAHSTYSERFLYRLGETVTPEFGFSASMVEECTSGIHFFTTFEEAAEYV